MGKKYGTGTLVFFLLLAVCFLIAVIKTSVPNKTSTKSTSSYTASSRQSSDNDDDIVDWETDTSVYVPTGHFDDAYCIVDDYLTGETDSIDLFEVYILLEDGIHEFYDATEINASDSWQEQERKLDLQDSIEPAKSALAELEEYLMGSADSVDLIKVHDGLAQGLLNYQDIS